MFAIKLEQAMQDKTNHDGASTESNTPENQKT